MKHLWVGQNLALSILWPFLFLTLVTAVLVNKSWASSDDWLCLRTISISTIVIVIFKAFLYLFKTHISVFMSLIVNSSCSYSWSYHSFIISNFFISLCRQEISLSFHAFQVILVCMVKFAVCNIRIFSHTHNDLSFTVHNTLFGHSLIGSTPVKHEVLVLRWRNTHRFCDWFSSEFSICIVIAGNISRVTVEIHR